MLFLSVNLASPTTRVASCRDRGCDVEAQLGFIDESPFLESWPVSPFPYWCGTACWSASSGIRPLCPNSLSALCWLSHSRSFRFDDPHRRQPLAGFSSLQPPPDHLTAGYLPLSKLVHLTARGFDMKEIAKRMGIKGLQAQWCKNRR